MTNKRYGLFLALAIVIDIAFIFADLSYYEEGADTFIKNTLAGAFTGQPALPPFSFGAHFILSAIYLQFYKLFPSIPWYDIFTLIYSCFAFFLVFTALSLSSQSRSFLLVFILGVLLFLDNLFLIEVTRISLTIALTCSFLLLHGKITLSPWLRTVVIFGLCLSVFVRIESFILGTALMVPLVFIYPESIKKIINILPAVALSLVLMVLLNYDWTERDAEYNDIREFQFVLLDYEVEENTNYSNKKDSIAMAAAHAFFLNDPAIINTALLAKYLPVLDKNPLHLNEYLFKTDFSLQSFKEKYYRLDFKYIMLWILLGLYIVTLKIHGRISNKLMAFSILYLSILCCIFLFMKMENRILLPTFTGLFLVIFTHTKIPSWHLVFYLIVLLVFHNLDSSKYKEIQERYASYMQIALLESELDTEAILVFDMHGVVWLGRKPFENIHFKHLLFSLDNALLFFTPEYKKYADKIFGEVSSSIVYAKFTDQNIYLIGMPPRIQIIHNYFTQVYGIHAELFIFEYVDKYNTIYQLKTP
jgi:hypothetical protein